MKKFIASIGLVVACVALITSPLAVQAASTPVQKLATTTLGSCTYTQSPDYIVFELNKIEYFNLLPITLTGAVKRVSGDFTNTVVSSVVLTTGTGSSTNLSEYLFKGDKLIYTGFGTNSGGSIRMTGVELP